MANPSDLVSREPRQAPDVEQRIKELVEVAERLSGGGDFWAEHIVLDASRRLKAYSLASLAPSRGEPPVARLSTERAENLILAFVSAAEEAARYVRSAQSFSPAGKLAFTRYANARDALLRALTGQTEEAP